MRLLRVHRCQQGLTLVELMIGITLSLLLLTGAISIFVGSKKTFRLQEDLARVQENVRYAVSRMITDISPAGYLGCAPSTQGGNLTVESMVEGEGSLYDFENVVSGVAGVSLTDPDSLTVRYALPETGMPVIAPTAAVKQTIQVDTNYPGYSELKKGDIIALSDCKILAVFMITNDPSGSGGQLAHDNVTIVNGVSNSKMGISHVFGDPRYSTAMVYKMDAVTYELDEKTVNGKTVRSLYATRLGGTRQELLTGVENFKVDFER